MDHKKIKLRNNNVEINFVDKGFGDFTLLFLHGWCINHTYWNSQLDYFSNHYRVVALDLPGFGNSIAKRTNWTMEEYSEDVANFINTVDLKNVILIGHSMAGEIILNLGLMNNDRIKGLVGIDNFKYVDFEFSEQDRKNHIQSIESLRDNYVKAAPAYAENELFHPNSLTSAKERVKADFGQANPSIAIGSFNNLLKSISINHQKLEQLSYRLNLLNNNTIPTHVEGLKNCCKSGFKLWEISEVGHYPMIEKEVEFNKILEDILNDFMD